MELPSVRVRIARRPGADDLPLPTRATSGSSGYDLYAAVEADTELRPGQRALIPTGVSIAVPEGYEAQVRPRSGLALEHGIVLPNAPGTIDSDYRGELRVILCNLGEKIVTTPESSMSILVLVASWMARMTFPPGPMMSRMRSGLMVTILTRGA